MTVFSPNGNGHRLDARDRVRELLESGELCEEHAPEARELLAESERLEREVEELERENEELERENAADEKWARQEVDDEYWRLKRAAHVAEHGDGRIAHNARIISGDTADEESSADWLVGSPMDPWADIPSKLDPLPGFPFLHAAASAIICGPTGGGRSSFIQACAYDGAKDGLRVLYLGGEVTEDEFNVRARLLTEKRDDGIEVRERLELVRYVDLTSTLRTAWDHRDQWKEAGERYDVVIIDPLNDALAATSRKHENQEYVEFYGRVVKPILDSGAALVMLDNVGHAENAQERAIGPSSKQHKADLTFHCKALDDPRRLQLITDKVRSVRCPFRKGTTWECDEDTQTISPVFGSSGPAPRKSKAARKRDEERTKILLALTLEERSLHALERSIGISRTTLRRRLLALEDDVLAEEGEAGWKLTEGGVQLSSSLESGHLDPPQSEHLFDDAEETDDE